MKQLQDSPHVAATKWEVRGREAEWKRTLVVMTDLVLDPGHADYDAAAETTLLAAISAYRERNPGLIEAVNVRSTREG